MFSVRAVALYAEIDVGGAELSCAGIVPEKSITIKTITDDNFIVFIFSNFAFIL